MDQAPCVTYDAIETRSRWSQRLVLVVLPLAWSLLAVLSPRLVKATELPHIVVILADDMGYGDVHALNPESRLATPHLDRLAGEALTFTDGHSPSAVCTPTRYGLLTGRYCWRTRLARGVLGGYSRPLLSPQRTTIGSLLQGCGYQTAAVGKWHLGMELPLREGKQRQESRWDGDGGVDFGARITDSPIHHGLDMYYGVSA